MFSREPLFIKQVTFETAHLKERYLRYLCVHANGERHLQKIGVCKTNQLLLRTEVAVPHNVLSAQPYEQPYSSKASSRNSSSSRRSFPPQGETLEMALSPSQSKAGFFNSQKKSASAPPSRAGSRNRNRSRSRSRESRKGRSRVDFFAYVNSNPDIQEAIEVIKSHPAGDELMEVLVAYFQQPGNKSDIINLANKLLVQPSSSHSRPIDRTQHISPQEPYHEIDSSS